MHGRFDGRMFSEVGHHRARSPRCAAAVALLLTLRPSNKIPRKVTVPDYAKRLPEGIRPFTTKGVYDLGKKTHLSFTQGAGHGGSHPHLAHEFVAALIERCRVGSGFVVCRDSGRWPRWGGSGFAETHRHDKQQS